MGTSGVQTQLAVLGWGHDEPYSFEGGLAAVKRMVDFDPGCTVGYHHMPCLGCGHAPAGGASFFVSTVAPPILLVPTCQACWDSGVSRLLAEAAWAKEQPSGVN
jgi:hypothetical protein